jgi:hypothetical protein
MTLAYTAKNHYLKKKLFFHLVRQYKPRSAFDRAIFLSAKAPNHQS